jgi:predicted DNA-binding transcriptional regulator AlpA
MLVGWKAICAYTGFSKSTLRRWMKKDGFPVLKGRGVKRPLSSRNLIDIWLAKNIENQKEILNG